jgi:hypothetical protein
MRPDMLAGEVLTRGPPERRSGGPAARSPSIIAHLPWRGGSRAEGGWWMVEGGGWRVREQGGGGRAERPHRGLPTAAPRHRSTSPDLEAGRGSTPMTALPPGGLAEDLSWARLVAHLPPLALGFSIAASAVIRQSWNELVHGLDCVDPTRPESTRHHPQPTSHHPPPLSRPQPGLEQA